MSKAILLLSIFALVSCGKGDEKPNYYEQDSLDAQSTDEFKTLVKGSSLSNDAPEGLGLLIKRGNNYSLSKVGTCTWFLVAPNVAATNSHCIPDILKQDKSQNCGDYIGGSFSDGSGSFSHAYCKKIISYSDISSGDFSNPDYAFIELSRSYPVYKLYSLSRAGYQDDEDVYVQTISTIQSGGDLYGRYKVQECVAQQNSLLGGFYNEMATVIPVFAKQKWDYSSCKIIPGNSGSPVSSFSAGTRVIKGIAFASQKEGTSLDITGIDTSKMHRFALLTNFSCQVLPENLGFQSADEKCVDFLQNEKDFIKKQQEEIYEKMKSDLEKMAEQRVKTLPEIFEYSLDESESNEQKIRAIPTCMKPTSQWSEEYLNRIVQTGSIFNRKKKIAISVPSFKLSVQLKTDEYGVLSYDLDFRRDKINTYNIDDIEEIDSTERLLMYEILYSRYTRRRIEKKYKIKLCEKSEEE